MGNHVEIMLDGECLRYDLPENPPKDLPPVPNSISSNVFNEANNIIDSVIKKIEDFYDIKLPR